MFRRTRPQSHADESVFLFSLIVTSSRAPHPPLIKPRPPLPKLEVMDSGGRLRPPLLPGVRMASGMWSVRVRNAVQSSKYLSSLLVTLLSFATHSRKTRKKTSTNVLLARPKAVKVLQVAGGDDCCAAGFLRKVEEARHESSLSLHPVLEPTQTNSRLL